MVAWRALTDDERAEMLYERAICVQVRQQYRGRLRHLKHTGADRAWRRKLAFQVHALTRHIDRFDRELAS